MAPTRVCTMPGCVEEGMPLKVNGNATGFRAHLFTLRRGVLPVRVFTLYCKGALYAQRACQESC